jgi:hypothetical protein
MSAPAPAQNVARALARPIVATGDFTGGAAENLFTMTAHGLVDGNRLYLIFESAAGVVGGYAAGDTLIVKKLTADTFQLTTDGTTVATNTADGTAVLLNVS